MSLTVEKLNDDTTFLLAFAPSFAPIKKSKARRFPGAFTILIDPWLAGRSSILHPSFQVSQHTSACAIDSLAELDHRPDLIIISQDKPDHCHKETLCSLPRDTHTRILATPAAAKKIHSWNYFDSSIIQIMKPYHSAKPDTIIRISLPAYTSTSAKGEITIANIPTKRDVTSVHNAIGITYRPPGSLLTTVFEGEPIDLLDMMSPASKILPKKLHKSKSAIKVVEAFHPAMRPRAAAATIVRTNTPRPIYLDPLGKTLPSAETEEQPHKTRPRASTAPTTTTTTKEPALSVLYTPHGLTPATLKPYLTNHLLPITSPLPLTALFHSLNTEQNPWFMGGKVSNGAPGGVLLAKLLKARYWVGAHDENKNLKGLATVWIKGRVYGVKEVEALLEGVGQGGTSVRRLGVGGGLRVEV